MQLDTSTHEKLLDLSWQLAAVRDPETLLREASIASAAFIRVDSHGVTEINLRTNSIRLAVFPDEHWSPLATACLTKIMEDHPVIRSYNSTPRLMPTRVTDHLSQREFEDSPTYAELFVPFGMRFQMNVPIYLDKNATSGAAFAFNRYDNDFTHEELAQARTYQTVVVSLHRALTSRAFDPAKADIAAQRMKVTARELDVLRLLVSNMTNVSIGRALRISPRTVNKHLENAYRKLEVRSRVEAIERCRALGLLR
ncbi:hypothetical protein GCM10009836_17990 [Pseudonocardia ailaonensis]|uniref:HTH luxR-type domain-containing protein n=1 Tax=Pseudonocardia ailaonensis TaxID=367279 RepID=A0ABN2MUK9_9PSEU